jgi:hypothetical protein
MASRPWAGNEVRLATGIDLVDGNLRALVGDTAPFVARRAGQASIRFVAVPRHGILAAVAPCDDLRARPGVRSIEITALVGRAVSPRPPAPPTG